MLSSQGVRPDETKIKSILEMPAPTDKKGVMRLLGTVNYLAKFLPDHRTYQKVTETRCRIRVDFMSRNCVYENQGNLD